MSCRSLRSLALLAAGVFAAACQEGSPTTPVEADLDLQLALTAAGDEAARTGDAERAEVLRHGAEAVRWGIRPSRIEVQIQNETYTYLAFVVGVQRRGSDDQPVIVRSLVAWTGRRPTALLNVISKTEQALFGHPNGGGNGNGNENDPGGARGTWKDLVNHELWVATAGSADLELVSTGGDCPTQPAAALRCVLASWDIRINGSFQLKGPDGPDGPPIQIHTNSDGVNGVVIKPRN